MATRPPPLLLTKRLTSFLHLNLSASVTTLLLLTPSGKLLAYASHPPIPVATLRTHGTVAASLYSIHSSGTDRETIDAALGPGGSGRREATRTTGTGAVERDAAGPLAVTIQLESGSVLVIRRLRCGMLFVCIGPPDSPSSRPQTQQQQQHPHHHHHHHQHQPQPATIPLLAGAMQTASGTTDTPNGHHTPSTSPPAPAGSGAGAGAGAITTHLGSPSDVASVLSAATGATAQTSASSVTFGAGTAGVMALRRHAGELARWLDDKLGTLEVPCDGLGGVV